MKIILATQNQGKIRELQELLVDEGIEVLSLLDIPDWEDVEENGETFADNAALKAKAAVKRTGLIALADDSGLEVDELEGAPGVYSARYAGEPKDDERNNDKLLQRLETTRRIKGLRVFAVLWLWRRLLGKNIRQRVLLKDES